MTSTQSQYRIITVCTGNICRSPMAELMLAEALAAAQLTGVDVDSAGITSYEVGRPIDPRAARKLAVHQIPSAGHIAREWRGEWFQSRDLILAMDVDHYGWLRQAAPDAAALAKIRMLRSFDPAVAGKDPLDQGIEDPWYGGHTDFDNTWDLIHASLPGLLDHVRAALAAPIPAAASSPSVPGPEKTNTGQRVRSIS